ANAESCPHLQYAGCPRRHQCDRARCLYWPYPQSVPRCRTGLLRLPRTPRFSHAEQQILGGQVMNASTTQPLLIELFTEELPPKALQQLGQAFSEGLQKVLGEQALLAPNCEVRAYATPRRLAAWFSAAYQQAEDQPYTEKLMPAHIGLDANGEIRSEEHTSELQSRENLVCRLLL